MKDRPYTLTPIDVRAILDGRKTQLRSVVECYCNTMHLGRLLGSWGLSNPPYQIDQDGIDDKYQWAWRWEGSKPPKAGDWIEVYQTDVDDNATRPVYCPFGVVGDRLWVRETWARNAIPLSDTHIDMSYVYRADGETRAQDHGCDKPWRSPVGMPRRASRLTLEITGIRCERLQKISEADALSEGVEPSQMCDAKTRFINLWVSIHGDGSYDANPWVWVVEFQRTRTQVTA